MKMNWKYEAIDKLKHYEAKKKAVQSIPDEIRSLEREMAGIRSAAADGSPVRGGGSGREDALLSWIVRKNELELSLKLAMGWVQRVDGALDVLGEDERLVLDRFYIKPAKGNVEWLCQELGVEKTTVYRRREDALYRFTIALYGCTEI